jgi:hypothetical protein
LILPSQVGQGEAFEVSITLENIGDVAGQEVVQLYIRDVASKVDAPSKGT